jgi:ABC-2 type transport system permease protein
MFRSIFTKTLRDWRLAIALWGIGLALMVYAYLPLYTSQLSQMSPGDLQRLAETQRFFAEPVEIASATGYTTWKVLAFLPLMLGIWAARAGARLGRYAEERGVLDIILATPRSRARYLGEGIAALVVALMVIGAAIGLGAMAGEAAADVPVAPGGALLAGLNISLVTLAVGMLALLLAQFFTSAGAATGAACGVLVLAYFLDGTGRLSPDLAWVGRLSPFHLYSLSKPLIASYGTNAGAMLALAALAALLGGASIPLFIRRDVGESAWPWRGRARHESGEAALAGAARDLSLRGIGPRALRAGTPVLIWWLIALAILLAWVALLTRQLKDSVMALLNSSSVFQQLLGGGNLATDAGFLSGFLFTLLPVLLAFFALTMASAWARDLDAGRLEMVLATPVPRWRVYLEAWGAILAVLIVVPFILCLVLVVSLRIFALQVDSGDLFLSFVGFLPIELITAAVIFLIAGRVSAGVANGGDSGLVASSFLADFLNPVLHLPGWLIGLSIFHYFGNPLLDGPSWGAWGVMSLLALALVGIGLLQFTRGDLQRA